ncbi:MAG: hypothetical protein ACRDQ0_12195 [Pseudonocardia sp.]
MTTTRTFTVAGLTRIGVPPDSPDDVQYSDVVLADEFVTTLKYSVQRRCVFRTDDGRAYAVTYEAEVDSGDYEHGPGPDNHGWYGDTVEAVEVEERAVTEQRWVPVEQQPADRAHPVPETPACKPADAVSTDTLARMLSAADVEINHGDYPRWDDLRESGVEQYRQAARYLLGRLTITGRPEAAAEPADRGEQP